MEAVVHYALDSDAYMQEFERKRIEFLMQQISEWSASELTALKELLIAEKTQVA